MAMYSEGVPARELGQRLNKLQQAMQRQGIDGALIVQKTDLFYYAGTSQQGWLYVPNHGEPLLMIFRDVERARHESPSLVLASCASSKFIPEILSRHGMVLPSLLALELDVLPTNLYFQYRKLFQPSEVTDISPVIRLLRAVKSDYEIGLLRQSAALADRVSAQVAELLEVGQTEVALASELEATARRLGHQGILRMRLWGGEIFYGHLLSGPSAAVPSSLASPNGGMGVSPVVGQGAGLNKIRAHEPILVDYAFVYNGYIADHTRIFSLGSVSDELLRAHAAMVDIQDVIKHQAVPGAVSGELYDLMLELAADKGYGANFMGVGERRVRFTGHGVGLELDEYPFIAKGQTLALETGMVLALEPKVVFPGKGMVGIENTHLVTEHGLEPLTTNSDEITMLPVGQV